jgi:hypothetical protein
MAAAGDNQDLIAKLTKESEKLNKADGELSAKLAKKVAALSTLVDAKAKRE